MLRAGLFVNWSMEHYEHDDKLVMKADTSGTLAAHLELFCI